MLVISDSSYSGSGREGLRTYNVSVVGRNVRGECVRECMKHVSIKEHVKQKTTHTTAARRRRMDLTKHS